MRSGGLKGWWNGSAAGRPDIPRRWIDAGWRSSRAITAYGGGRFAVDESILDRCIVGHASAEPGHRRPLDAIEQHPLVDLDMRLGEGSGAAPALVILKGVVARHNGMATFDEANVSGKSPESA